MTETYRALVVEKATDAPADASLQHLAPRALEPGEVRVAVEYSGVNYKDALALAGRPGIIRAHPLTAGIDLAGTVAESTDARFAEGDPVLVNGWGLGETQDGGLAEQAVVRGDQLTRIPTGLDTWQAAALGTAGFTAALGVLALEDAATADGPFEGRGLPSGEILVTGAGGGVGGLSILLASRGPAAEGRPIVAATGRAELEPYLRSLGARGILDRAELSRESKPLESERWAAVIDSVGGTTLVTALAQLRYGGLATAAGMAESIRLPGTVMPFILRGVRLQGVNSVLAPTPLRERAWAMLAERIDAELLRGMVETVPLEAALGVAEDVLAGRVRGRIAVDARA